MCIKKTITQIKDPSVEKRDLLIDDLTDLIEYGSTSYEERLFIFSSLSSMLVSESSAINESIFNLLSTMFFEYSQEYLNKVPQICLDNLSKLEPGSLVHALQIISQSNLMNKMQIIEQYTASDNSAVRELAIKLVQSLTSSG